jgi:hypothetical protein
MDNINYSENKLKAVKVLRLLSVCSQNAISDLQVCSPTGQLAAPRKQ